MFGWEDRGLVIDQPRQVDPEFLPSGFAFSVSWRHIIRLDELESFILNQLTAPQSRFFLEFTPGTLEKRLSGIHMTFRKIPAIRMPHQQKLNLRDGPPSDEESARDHFDAKRVGLVGS